ncbi:MAG: hypothetical protein Q4C65_01715 [Eubacteriales bacterium]|nr:hypothetical protein [Eubacteriales bacterium]
MIQELLSARRLPLLWSGAADPADPAAWEANRPALLNRLAECCYGKACDVPCEVQAKQLDCDPQALGGQATEYRVLLTLRSAEGKSTSLPLTLLLPPANRPVPVFLWPRFQSSLDTGFYPAEEILDAGYGLAVCYYQDIALDSAQTDAGLFETTERYTWGKIAKWAFGLSRIMDYLETVPDIDAGRIALLGESRLGKTVLWTAANDRRFSLVIPAFSGTGGVSLYRGNEKETLKRLLANFPYWFCADFAARTGSADNLFFDSHTLIALCAPKRFYTCMGESDPFVDYHNEFLACCAASPAYRLYEMEGLSAPDRWPAVSRPLQDGAIGFHVRPGGHFLCRYDWQQLMGYRNRYHL